MSKKILLNIVLILLIYNISCTDDSSEEDNNPVAAPILLDPENISGESFTARWLGDATATSHLVDISKDENFIDILSDYNQKSVTAESLVVSGLVDNTQYFIRVASLKDMEKSEYSSVKSARTIDIPDPEPELALRTLTDLPIGAAVQASRLNGSYGQRVSTTHSSLTAEFEMKMKTIFTGIGEYNFTPGDAIVEFAEANDMQVHAHALIWHLSTPDFLENFSGTDQEFENLIRDYIHEVVGHYKGKVASWDVVNEAVNDENGGLRNSIYQQRMGDDFIAKCFQFAREADPDVLLFYNDYNIMFDETKLDASLSIIKDMQDRGIDADGIGFQSHLDINFPTRNTIATSLNKAVDLGLLVHISELDIKVNPGREQNIEFNTNLAQRQRTKYIEVVEEFLRLPRENQFAITIWGVIDGQSWIPNFIGAPDFPLLFNDDLSPKSAHTGVAEAIQNAN